MWGIRQRRKVAKNLQKILSCFLYVVYRKGLLLFFIQSKRSMVLQSIGKRSTRSSVTIGDSDEVRTRKGADCRIALEIRKLCFMPFPFRKNRKSETFCCSRTKRSIWTAGVRFLGFLKETYRGNFPKRQDAWEKERYPLIIGQDMTKTEKWL